MRLLKTKDIAVTSAFTGLVCAATMIFTVYVPATKGFFNIGETMVYVTALVFGAKIGAFAGGVGSALADIFLGYYYYAPATLLIKAGEGAIVGSLSSKRISLSLKNWRLLTFSLGIIVALAMVTVGSTYYIGRMELTLGFPQIGMLTMTVEIPIVFWITLALTILVVISLVGYLLDPELGWPIFAILLGGFEMVMGYFIYELFLVGYYAFFEIPVNIAQVIVGLVIALPVYKSVRRIIPKLITE
jgi:uncharacterized membrane protein